MASYARKTNAQNLILLASCIILKSNYINQHVQICCLWFLTILCAFFRYCIYLGAPKLTINLLRKKTNYLTVSKDVRRTAMDTKQPAVLVAIVTIALNLFLDLILPREYTSRFVRGVWFVGCLDDGYIVSKDSVLPSCLYIVISVCGKCKCCQSVDIDSRRWMLTDSTKATQLPVSNCRWLWT